MFVFVGGGYGSSPKIWNYEPLCKGLSLDGLLLGALHRDALTCWDVWVISVQPTPMRWCGVGQVQMRVVSA